MEWGLKYPTWHSERRGWILESSNGEKMGVKRWRRSRQKYRWRDGDMDEQRWRRKIDSTLFISQTLLLQTPHPHLIHMSPSPVKKRQNPSPADGN